MDLLPRSSSEFQSVDYWDKFFKKRGGAAFEWYGEYGDLCEILHKYSKSSNKVLMIGCGNSTLSEDLYDVGYHQLINIDISKVVIKNMTTRNASTRPKMKFIEMDVQKMTFDDNHFNVVIDKGTLDAIMSDSEPATIESVQNMFSEIDRVVNYGGRYICISLAQQHIAKEIVTWFTNKSWLVRVHKVITDDNEEKKSAFALPVFVFVCTKFKPIMASKAPLPLDVFFTKNSSNLRLESAEAVITAIKAQQDYHVMRHSLKTRSVDEEQLSFQLYNAKQPTTPRFTLFVVDSKGALPPANKFAVFIVPQGREVEWLFSNPKGRVDLAKSASFQRLIVVTLHRDNQYESLKAIQDELSGDVMELAPSDLPENTKVPFLSIGDDIGKRTIVERGTSQLSGDFIIEDVETQGESMRRLIFMKSQHHVQSESKLKKVSVRSKGGKRTSKVVIDRSYISFETHKGIIAGLALIPNFQQVIQHPWKFLLIGLGGGGLPVVLHSMFPTIELDVVELDPAIIKIAQDRFGVVPDQRLQLLEGDGIRFIVDNSQTNNNVYDVICFDVNASEGSIWPPKEFLQKTFLLKVQTLLKQKGLFALNFGCREDNLKASSLATIKEVFPAMIIKPIEGEVNCVVCASSNIDQQVWQEKQSENLPPTIELLQNKVKQLSSEEFDIAEMFSEIFGMVPDKRLQLLEGDGVKFIEDNSKQANNVYDVICFDVNASEGSIGGSIWPPKEFLQTSFLLKVQSLLKQKGLFALNFGCREDNLKASSLATIKEVFPAMIIKPIEGEVNCVVCASSNIDQQVWQEKQSENLPPTIELLQNKVKKLSSEEFDIAEMFSEMQIQ
ncbi:eEF1A lysine and N-terminal methyltransferase-like [Antedon mediterranea]|uniref:eEF1A lysine and N-terminal methyltransferase-like n=1 Tax=Antedon mediterranea TaxID=105859 RepID=UPI003AF67723